jgi:SpoIID/LytB domain protein
MQVVQRSPGGRILKLAVQTERGNLILEKDEIRSAFSAPRSTLFYLEPLFNQAKGENKTLWGYAFVGGGLGHGVGLSQTGAYSLAKLGWTSDRILNFYYPGTQIQTRF